MENIEVLCGVGIILVGFALRLDTLAVVVVAGLVTGLVAGLGFVGTLEIFGGSFVGKRFMPLFMLSIPAVGILERHGMREKAAELMERFRSVSSGSVLTVYLFFRELAAALSMRLGGHVQFIRPLVYPMARSAAVTKFGEPGETLDEELKGASAAVENYGNFFGQNVFPAASGVLLMMGCLAELGYPVMPKDLANNSIPIAGVAFLLAVILNMRLDRRIAGRLVWDRVNGSISMVGIGFILAMLLFFGLAGKGDSEPTQGLKIADHAITVLYWLVGLYSLSTAWQALRTTGHPSPWGSAAFWGIFGAIMMAGDRMPSWLVGGFLLVLAVLTAARQVRAGPDTCPEPGYRKKEAVRVGWRLFIPPLALGVLAFLIAQLAPTLTGLSGKQAGLLGLGAGGLVSLLLALLVTRSPVRHAGVDGGRLLQQMGSATLLPLVLAALGTVFQKAGVDKVIAAGIEVLIPEGSLLAGVVAYCLGMALFTVIMGNAFAAFLVITAGIGVPFVIVPGGDPALVAALGMTAGYCGTLVTPMAANFNIIPVAILEARSQYRVIRSQLPLALTLLAAHMVIMYGFAF